MRGKLGCRFSCSFVLFASLATAQTLQVGTAEVVITPPKGIPMAGYYSTRLSTGVHDDLKAKAIVISSGEQRAALVACDLIGIPPAVIEEARDLIQTAAGIPAANVMISATHSHTGPLLPAGGSRDGAYGGLMENARQYRAEIPRKIAESVRLASTRMVPARVLFGKGREDGLSFNRRFFMKDGTVGWNPGKLNPNIVKPAGPIDPEVPVVLFESPQGEPLATYLNFAMHLDTVGGLDVSADYPFTLSNILGRVKSPSMLTMFTIGAAGNINHVNVKSGAPQKGHEEAARIGTILAGEVVKTYARLEAAKSGALQIATRMVKLDPAHLDPADEERANAIAKQVEAGASVKTVDAAFAFKVLDTLARAGKPLDAEVQVIALGDQIAWVALPGEIFTELAASIKEASPFPMTIVAELAHGPVTYFPNSPAFPQGNYEVVTSRAAQGSGEKMVAAAKALLREMYPPLQQAITPRATTMLFNGRDFDGWYTWLKDDKYADPKKVFSIQDGVLRISGEEFGGLTTRRTYRDYHLIVEWKWGTATFGERAGKARDSGVLVHGVGEDGAYNGTFIESIESQIIEGGVGDIILVGGKRQPRLTAEARETPNGQTYWQEGAKPITRDRGRFNWYGRDPDWKDVAGFRGRQEVELPHGEWNRSEVICDGDTVKMIVNGKVVNYGVNASHTFGKIQLQSEGAEIFIRRVEMRPLAKER